MKPNNFMKESKIGNDPFFGFGSSNSTNGVLEHNSQNLVSHVGFEIKRARKIRKISQAELAKGIDVSIPTVHAMESGCDSVAIGTFTRAVCLLDMKIADLCTSE